MKKCRYSIYSRITQDNYICVNSPVPNMTHDMFRGPITNHFWKYPLPNKAITWFFSHQSHQVHSKKNTSLAPLHALVGTAWKPLEDLRTIWGLANKAYMKPCSVQNPAMFLDFLHSCVFLLLELNSSWLKNKQCCSVCFSIWYHTVLVWVKQQQSEFPVKHHRYSSRWDQQILNWASLKKPTNLIFAVDSFLSISLF